MFHRRKASERFSTIINKENKNFINLNEIQLEADGHKKGFVLRLTSGKKDLPKETKVVQDKEQEKYKKDSQAFLGFKTFRKPIKPDDLPPTQCPRLTKKSPNSSNDSLELKISPKFLDFCDKLTPSSQQKDSEWKVEVIEILPPLDNFFYDGDQSDEEVKKWYNKFEEYDMDSDKENMPLSDDEQSDIDSDYENENDQQTSDQVYQIYSGQKRPMITPFCLDFTLKKQKLQEIHQVDETSNTNIFITKMKE